MVQTIYTVVRGIYFGDVILSCKTTHLTTLKDHPYILNLRLLNEKLNHFILPYVLQQLVRMGHMDKTVTNHAGIV